MRKNRREVQVSGQKLSHKSQTFLDHIIELRTRLFWVVLTVILASGMGAAFQTQLIDVLMQPLGSQRLVYLTPIGGFSFIIKICFYFGFLLAVPVLVYHMYRYVEPLMRRAKRRAVLGFVLLSALLASGGVAFAYFVSLPAALRFLTGFNLQRITAMLTVDSYLTFVVTYLLGAALLFQIPLILLIIDNITPLKPSNLMKYQRHVFLAAFIVAAMISPTPDMVNQALLALPIIGMYQCGLLLVWWQSLRRRRRLSSTSRRTGLAQNLNSDPLENLGQETVELQAASRAPARTMPSAAAAKHIYRERSARTVDGFYRGSALAAPRPPERAAPVALRRHIAPRQSLGQAPPRTAQPRFIDGFIVRTS